MNYGERFPIVSTRRECDRKVGRLLDDMGSSGRRAPRREHRQRAARPSDARCLVCPIYTQWSYNGFTFFNE